MSLVNPDASPDTSTTALRSPRTPLLIGPAARALAAIHTVVLCAIYGFLAAKAVLEFRPYWDYLSYHLPDALRRFGLTTYTEEPHLVIINEAWPPLAHLAQGLMVFLTKRISTANGANALLFLFVSALLAGLLRPRVSWRWFFTALLAVPLFCHHLVSGYVDLFANLFLLLSFGALFALEFERKAQRIQLKTLAILLAGIAGAMLSKLQAWPTAGIIAMYSFFYIAWLARRDYLSRRTALLFLVALVVCASAWPIRNIYRYGNPTYPAQFPIAPSLFPNYSMPAATSWNIPKYLRESSKATAFVHSAFELSRLQTEEPLIWNPDQAAADWQNSPHHRVGGWFFATMLLLTTIGVWTLIAGRVPRGPMGIFVATILATSIIPQSHELRYWLYIPMTLALCFAMTMKRLEMRTVRVLAQTAVGGCAIYVLTTLDLFSLDLRPAAAYAPPEAIAFWEEQRRNPTQETTDVCGKMPNAIYWTGPTFNQFKVQGCH